MSDDTAPEAPHAERRGSARRKLQAEIGLHSESHFYTGFSEDLSDGGLFIATYQEVPIQSPVHVDFELPTGAKISAKGRVAWRREAGEGHTPGLGIAFESLTDAERDAILEFVRERPPLFYADAI